MLAWLASANALGVDGAGIGTGAYIAGGCDACIGGAYEGGSGSGTGGDDCIGGGAYDGDGDIDAGSGRALDDCIGAGAYDGDGDIDAGSGSAADAGSGGGNVGERGFCAEGAIDADGAVDAGGAIDGARGASGAFPAMRFVAGAWLVGAMLTGGLLSACVSSWDGAGAFTKAAGAGGFAAGATPTIVLLSAARALPTGRGIRGPVSALGFRPSVPKTAPMRKL